MSITPSGVRLGVKRHNPAKKCMLKIADGLAGPQTINLKRRLGTLLCDVIAVSLCAHKFVLQ
jgi:hypothetical protein